MSALFYLPGILCILFGILIIMMPEILVALVATFFFMIGFSLIGVGRKFSISKSSGTTIFIK
jgi:hypothetical protein